MQTKLFNLKDDGTRMRILCINFNIDDTDDYLEKEILSLSGYSSFPVIGLLDLESQEFNTDSFKWMNRTLHVAHEYICDNYDILNSGDTINIPNILKNERKQY